MLPDRVSNPGPLTYESSALSIALRGPASTRQIGLGYVVLICRQVSIYIVISYMPSEYSISIMLKKTLYKAD